MRGCSGRSLVAAFRQDAEVSPVAEYHLRSTSSDQRSPITSTAALIAQPERGLV
jgi:hypothetical protein